MTLNQPNGTDHPAPDGPVPVLVVYESMYGNTHHVAEAVAEGLRATLPVEVKSVAEARAHGLVPGQALVVGGPTHAHGLSRPETRHTAAAAAGPDEPPLEPGAEGWGLREWLDSLGLRRGPAAAFDTRLSGMALLTGRASRTLTRLLRDQGFTVVADPESFLVDTHDRLLAGQLEQARRWGAGLSPALAPR